MTVAAKYEDGVFKPLQNIALDRPRSIRELGFVGMWADRCDITGGVSYVNNLRNDALLG